MSAARDVLDTPEIWRPSRRSRRPSVRHFPILLGLLLLGSSFVRAVPPKPLFEDDIEAFEAADRAHAPPQGAVLFVGSSSIRFWDTLERDFPGVPVINRGFGGSSIADCIWYADRIVIPYHPRRIVFYAGDNDVAAGRKPEEVRDDFRRFVEKVRRALPGVPIVFVSIKPSLERWKLVDRMKKSNELIRKYAASSDKITYIDVFAPMLGADGRPRKELFRADGLHMTPAGYALWARLLRPDIK
jgi:lysophospholipase L1-like esterase